MTHPAFPERKKARFQFIAIYALSVVLVFAVIAVCWNDRSAAASLPARPATGTGKNQDFLRLDTLLHGRLAQLDAAASVALNDSGQMLSKNLEAVSRANGGFQTLLDSIEQGASLTGRAEKINTARLVLTPYRTLMNNRNQMINRFAHLATVMEAFKDGRLLVNNHPAGDSQQVEALKSILTEKERKVAELEQQNRAALQEKEKTILALRSQLAQKEHPANVLSAAMNNSGAAASEWKQKHDALKLTYQKALDRENALKLAYKAVVEDNRRLFRKLNEH